LRDVGENRVQEALPKIDATSVPVRWHLIGHLQRNKAKVVRGSPPSLVGQAARLTRFTRSAQRGET
jgi:uncharacterized pyridoxal phosphate-containing UPF0001 family protein